MSEKIAKRVDTFTPIRAWMVRDTKWNEWWVQEDEPSAEWKLTHPRGEYAPCMVTPTPHAGGTDA